MKSGRDRALRVWTARATRAQGPAGRSAWARSPALRSPWTWGDALQGGGGYDRLARRRREARQPKPGLPKAPLDPAEAPPSSLGEFKDTEKVRILEALEMHSWNRVRAAKALGMARRTFCRRLKEYEIL